MRVHIDFEVFSNVNLATTPIEVYASDPSTRIILCAYAFDEGPVEVWESDKGPSPKDLSAAIRNPENTLVAWNINYERSVLTGKGIDIPLERWLDPMVLARYAGLPGRLKDCAKIPMIGVPAEEATKSEMLLIKKFCMPKGKIVDREGGGKAAVPGGDGRRIMPSEHPEDWAKFVDYCRKDVQTMRHILNWLEPRFPFPDKERQIWILDQQINERGLPVDVGLARCGQKEVERIIQATLLTMAKITGLENPNSVQQLLPWLQERGYRPDSLGKEFLVQSFKSDELTDDAREVISLRLESAKSSVKKFKALVEETSPDGRLRHQFKYGGAHTLRWSGRGVQPQNLTRQATDKDALQVLLEASEAAACK